VKARKALLGELIRRKLVDSQDEALLALSADRVRVNGAVVTNGKSMVAPGDALHVVGPPQRFVGRGGEKLFGALETFGIDVAGRFCLDVGASTGGFTDCLLQRGAAHVVAVDVGRAQLHHRILSNERVTSLEGCNVTELSITSHEGYENGADVVVGDVSFTSLAALVPTLVLLSGPAAHMVLMVKPQFEADRWQVPAGGVVTDYEVHRLAWEKVEKALVEAGCLLRGRCESPITGISGNREFFVWAVAHNDG